ncbi:hypothetical protein [Helicobacter sp. MIT 05-5294]|uniref:hypothetical protein n=1 Tax=Helicobacter sp. MIT 05-5294 TaxID=1548150 RepID=UPI00051FB5D8|nr:hypothetical protein [Helicobacter sp. MIT 05-5294]TLD87842.1 hypothetical protein LS69_003355 [Helicobacter sp. MIT 05-5294]
MRTKKLQKNESIAVAIKHEKNTLEAKREMVKIGMATSLFLTSTSALFMDNKTAKAVHIGAGIALVGFCLWHASLYPKS